eukprot:403355929
MDVLQATQQENHDQFNYDHWKYLLYAGMHLAFFIIFTLCTLKILCIEKVKLDKFSYLNVFCFMLGFLVKAVTWFIVSMNEQYIEHKYLPYYIEISFGALFFLIIVIFIYKMLHTYWLYKCTNHRDYIVKIKSTTIGFYFFMVVYLLLIIAMLINLIYQIKEETNPDHSLENALNNTVMDLLVPIFNYSGYDSDQWAIVIKIINFEIIFYGITDFINSLNILYLFYLYGKRGDNSKKKKMTKKNKNKSQRDKNGGIDQKLMDNTYSSSNDMIHDINLIIEENENIQWKDSKKDVNLMNDTQQSSTQQNKQKINKQNKDLLIVSINSIHDLEYKTSSCEVHQDSDSSSSEEDELRITDKQSQQSKQEYEDNSCMLKKLQKQKQDYFQNFLSNIKNY